ncbi:MAG: aldo/keto reductase [Egibacteraceae bacterium]
MRTVQVQGEQIPALGIGTWQLTGARGRRVVVEALDLGYRHIDTAQMYGNEGAIGEALQTTMVDRGELWITTKIANGNHAPQDVRRSTEESLHQLGTEYVDLLLIHWPAQFDMLPRTLEAMRGLHEEGKARYLGVSNFSPTQLETALEHASLLTNQVEYHPFIEQRALLDLCRRRDLMLTAYSPLAQGRVQDDRTLKEVAERRRKTASQVALRWLIDQDNVSAIPKASSREHLQDNLAIFDFELTDEDRAAIDGIAW